jgi:dihydroorotase
VLPLLWQALVVEQGWSEQELWQALSFGPSQLLQRNEERLVLGSNRWLLYDPDHRWVANLDSYHGSQAANQPLLGQEITGAVVDCGLRSPENLSG